MTVRKRMLIIGSLFAAFSVLYGAAKHYSPSLVLYVVEQSLIQKAPPGIDTASLRERFHRHISAVPDKSSRMKRLLRISEYLEKVQHLTLEQLDELLAIEAPGVSHSFPGCFDTRGRIMGNIRLYRLFPENWNFFALKDV